jgi:hypothetical protein
MRGGPPPSIACRGREEKALFILFLFVHYLTFIWNMDINLDVWLSGKQSNVTHRLSATSSQMSYPIGGLEDIPFSRIGGSTTTQGKGERHGEEPSQFRSYNSFLPYTTILCWKRIRIVAGLDGRHIIDRSVESI